MFTMPSVFSTALALFAISLPVACAHGAVGAPSASNMGRATLAADTCATPLSASASPHLSFVVLGSGGPRSFGRAASGYLVVVDGRPRALIDVGPGAFLRLGQLDADFLALDTILLTHLHIDHSGDLPAVVKSRDLSYAMPLSFRIFGPGGGGSYPSTRAFVDRLLGSDGAFAYLKDFRNQLTLDVTDIPAGADATVHELYRDHDLRVSAIAVDHDDVPAVAYRIDVAGGSIVVSGDLASKNDNMVRLATGADLLVYDAAVLDPPGSPAKLYDLHTSPRRIGEIAAKAGVRSVLLSHLSPAVEREHDAVIRSVGLGFRGTVRFAADCMRIDVAPGVARQ